MTEDTEKRLRAIASIHRLRILAWLKDPTHHFRAQIDGDLVADGVCALLIAEKLGLAQPTTAQHLRSLVESGLLTPKRIKKWTFYRRNERNIAALTQSLSEQL